ncbi:MAG: glycosyltransferase family 1 protein [Candidatus Sericytochromatia bacterium]
MKIAIDARSLTKNLTGIASFLLNAINELITQNPNWEFYLLVPRPLNIDIEKKLIKTNNVHIVLKKTLLSKIGSFWYIFQCSSFLKGIKPDIFWSPATLLPFNLPKNIKSLVTVHDVVFKDYKNTMSLFNIFTHTLLFDKSIKNADILWTVSQYTKNKILEYYPEIRYKNIFVGSCVDKRIYRKIDISKSERESFLNRYNLTDKCLLFVGTLEPRKNISYLLSLMRELAKKNYSLLVIGAKGWGKTNIKDIIEKDDFPKDKVIFADFTPPDELVKIYNMAHIYISTSLNEGFGLPQLEAMSCSCPVISSHNSAMIEVVENGGVTVKGFEKEDWLKAIYDVSENRDFYSNSSFNKSKQYNWEDIVKDLSKIICL